MLSAVEHRSDTRILYDGLEHDPDHKDMRACLGRLQTALTARHVTLVGLTTDGAALSPAPLAALWSGVHNNIWTLNVIAEVGKAVLGAVTRERKRLAATHPRRPQGRPTTQAAQ